jgi:hypothetical protein
MSIVEKAATEKATASKTAQVVDADVTFSAAEVVFECQPANDPL